MSKAADLDRLYGQYAQTVVLQQVAAGRPPMRGHGPLDSPLAVVGEAPGEDEETQGRPFVGRSGKLLQRMFAAAGLPWELCYVTNVLPWRPPGNRTPYPFEISASARRVEAEIDTVSPRIVIAAGAVAWRCITENDLGSFTEHRGELLQFPWKDWLLLPVWHPAAILRAAGAERQKMEADTISALRSVLAASDAP